jgi:hypothetical protein
VLEVALVDFHFFVVHFVCFPLLLFFLLVLVILMMPSVVMAALVPRPPFLLE